MVRVGRRPGERLNGYPTLVLERAGHAAVLVAPFGMTLLSEIAHLFSTGFSATHFRTGTDGVDIAGAETATQ